MFFFILTEIPYKSNFSFIIIFRSFHVREINIYRNLPFIKDYNKKVY